MKLCEIVGRARSGQACQVVSSNQLDIFRDDWKEECNTLDRSELRFICIKLEPEDWLKSMIFFWLGGAPRLEINGSTLGLGLSKEDKHPL